MRFTSDKRYKNQYVFNPYYGNYIIYSVYGFLQNNGFVPMNINGENVFVNSTNFMAPGQAIKINFIGNTAYLEAWLVGKTALGDKLRFEKEMGLEGVFGLAWKQDFKARIVNTIENLSLLIMVDSL